MAATTAESQLEDVQGRLATLRRTLAEAGERAKERLVTAPTEWGKEHPAATLGIATGLAAGLGFTLGLLVRRRRA